MAIKVHNADSSPFKSLAFFKNLKLFINLPDEEVRRFVDVAKIKNYKKGQFLYSDNEQATFFYVICSGWLKLFHATAEGEEMLLAMLTKDNITGVRALFEEEQFTKNAQVVVDAEILCVPLALLKERMRVDNQLVLNMMSCMVQQQNCYELQQEQNFFHSAPQRIGCFLLGLCPTLEQKDGAIINLPYDKVQIAAALGMKAQTFSRALHILFEQTGINMAGPNVTINSMERLFAFVEGAYLPQQLYKNLS